MRNKVPLTRKLLAFVAFLINYVYLHWACSCLHLQEESSKIWRFLSAFYAFKPHHRHFAMFLFVNQWDHQTSKPIPLFFSSPKTKLWFKNGLDNSLNLVRGQWCGCWCLIFTGNLQYKTTKTWCQTWSSNGKTTRWND